MEPVDQTGSRAVPQRPRETEAFVHRDPRNNAGVILIALDGGSELIHQSLLRLSGVLVKVRHLGPDQEAKPVRRSEEHTSELQSQSNLVCRLLLEKKKIICSLDATSSNSYCTIIMNT